MMRCRWPKSIAGKGILNFSASHRFASLSAIRPANGGSVQHQVGSQHSQNSNENQRLNTERKELNARKRKASQTAWLPEELDSFKSKLNEIRTTFISLMETELESYSNHENLKNAILELENSKTKRIVSLIKKASTDQKAIISKMIKENHKYLTLPLALLMNRIGTVRKKPPLHYILELIDLNLLLDEPLTARSLFLNEVRGSKRFEYDTWFYILDFVASKNVEFAMQDVIQMLQLGISPVSSKTSILPKVFHSLSLRKSYSDIELLVNELNQFESRNLKNNSTYSSIWTPNLALILLKAYEQDFSKILPIINNILDAPKTSQKTKTNLVCSVLHQALIQDDTEFVENLLLSLKNDLSQYRPVFRILMKHAINSNSNRDALSLFSQMQDKHKLNPSVTDWVLYSQALLADGQFKEAIVVIRKHIVNHKSNDEENQDLFFSNEDLPEIGKPWSQKKNRIHPATIAFNNVIAEYARRDLILEAERILRHMIDLSIEVTEFSVLPLIHYYGKNGMEKQAVAHYKRLLIHDTFSILAIKSIYSHWLKRHYPEFQVSRRIRSTLSKSDWSCLIDSFPVSSTSPNHTVSLPNPKTMNKKNNPTIESSDDIPPECPDMRLLHLKFCNMLKTYGALAAQSQFRINRSLFQYHCMVAGGGEKSPRYKYRYGAMTNAKTKNLHAVAAEQLYFLFRQESVNGIYESALVTMFRERGEMEKVERVLNQPDQFTSAEKLFL